MTEKAFQDYYPDDLNYCYGCGRGEVVAIHVPEHMMLALLKK